MADAQNPCRKADHSLTGARRLAPFDKWLLAQAAEELIKMAKYNVDFDLDTKQVSVAEARTWRGHVKAEVIHGFPCTRYELKNVQLAVSYQDVAGGKLGELPKASTEDPEVLADLLMDNLEESDAATSTTAPAAPPAEPPPRHRSLFHRPRREPSASRRHFRWKAEASIWVTQDFPFSLQDLLPILDVVGASHRRVQRLREFLGVRFPEGFPVRIDLPIVC
eukprot:EG_transcript_22185